MNLTPPFPLVLLGLILVFASGTGARLGAAQPSPSLAVVPEFFDDQTSWNPADPLAVRVYLRHATAVDDAVSDTPLTLDPGQPWPETVTLDAFGPDGRPITLPWVRTGTTETFPLTLTPANQWSMGFFLPANPVRALAAGRYQLQATIEITSGTGWRGRVTSPATSFEITAPAGGGTQLGISVLGADALTPGDPWVVSLELTPPLLTFAETSLRSGYRLSVTDEAGRDPGWAFDPAATPPSLGTAAELNAIGLSPVLVVLSAALTAQATPGIYQLTALWQAGGTGQVLTNRIAVRVQARSVVEAQAGREAIVLRRQFAEATALLWRAEFGSTAEISTLVARAAPLLIAAERRALNNFAAASQTVDAALVVAEVFLLEGDFDGARAFARLATSLWTPPQVTAEQLAEAGPPRLPTELTELLRLIDTRAAQAPGRVLPVLRPALVAARGFDLTDPNSLAPGEAAWATSARASSEYRATDYSARQATGAPDVTAHGDNPRAWASLLANAGEEWLELTYAPAFRASGIRVIQSFNPGALQRLEVIDEAGVSTVVWTGPDPTVYPPRQIGVFTVSFPPTERPIARVRVTLDTRRVAGWNEIDAVLLIAASETPPPAPVLAYQLGPTAPRTLSIPTWPAGFRLERSTRLAPADWTPVATNPPFSLNPDRDAVFLRLRQHP